MASQSSSEQDRYTVLVEFVYKHVDFHMAELQSVLDMYDISLGSPECQIIPLPNADIASESSDPITVENYKHERPFVVLSFPRSFVDLEHLSTDIHSSKWKAELKTSAKKMTPAEIGEMLNRCTLVRSVVELWGYATDMDLCAEKTKAFTTAPAPSLEATIFSNVSSAEKSWKVTVHTLGSKYTREEQDEMRRKFSYLGFEGPVQMEGFDNEFILLREVEMDSFGNPLYPRHEKKKIIPENDARPPLGVYFGRVVNGLRTRGRDGLDQYNLKNRKYLGPTSMDAELSFVMTTLAQVKKGSIVYDPFVGTGSILLSCALRGAYCIGSDIDIRVLKGKGDDQNIWTNFDQYKLQRPEILRSDNSMYHRHYREHVPLYDAIVTDPPYGIRAGARRTGSRRDNPTPILEEHRHDHIAQTKPYLVSDVMSDLLDMSARSLSMGGRLVYIIPSFADFNPDTDLPRHDCLTLVHSCYQPLGTELGRRMVVMKKTCEYDPEKREKYLETTWVNGTESADKCANLKEKILENAKKKPGYDEKLAIRKQKRRETKQAKKQAKRAKLTSTEE
eukprot:Nitzschia sp. Nitz4//scaffold74_size92883//19417//21099//NITZ4_004816-RA/size92883-processed-gene-0.3-mRNA-1//1//CDS//3329557574//5518//frame0